MASASFKVEENSAGWQAIQRALASLRQGDSYVKAGITGAGATTPREDGDEGAPLTNAELATVQEFGTKDIPPRPFVNGTFLLHREQYIGSLKTLLPAVYAGRVTIPFMLNVVGLQMASDMKERIAAGEPPFTPNAPSTIAAKLRKGKWNKGGLAADASPKPLINTGRMRNAITHEVVLQETK